MYESLESQISLCHQYITQKYPDLIGHKEKEEQLYNNILCFFSESHSAQEPEIISRFVFNEIEKYSILTDYIENRDDVEEININAWNHITVTNRQGEISVIPGFLNPDHALSIVRRMLRESGNILDNSTPLSQGELHNGLRITAMKEPLVSKNAYVSASIRKQHYVDYSPATLQENKTISREMFSFLESCMNYGISFIIAGATSSGKTTLMNALLSALPTQKRIFTIESGSREISPSCSNDENNLRNIVQTLSRPSEDSFSNIDQESLVKAALRFTPDIIAIGEMRDFEAKSAIEASLTGHCVLSTLHAQDPQSAHFRLAMLCRKKDNLDFDTALLQASLAFPIIVCMGKTKENKRIVFEVSECIVTEDGHRKYRTLFENLNGYFEVKNQPSDHLINNLKKRGWSESNHGTEILV